MSSLKDVRDTLLTIAHPDAVLKYADNLMEVARKSDTPIRLAAADSWLKPLIEFYTDDLAGWLKFVKGVRDRLAPESRKHAMSDEYRAVQSYYKILQVRYIQQRTRAVIAVATELAIQRGVLKDTWAEKQRYAKVCVVTWSKRRDVMLKAVRSASPSGRVSVTHREELLQEFWDNIATEVNEGNIPPP